MPAPTIFTYGYALLIAVNEHSVADWALPDVAKDIDALHAVLTHPDRCAYPADHVRTLRGAAATRTAILDGLDWLHTQIAADTSGNATAVVYYTGHGWRNETAQPPAYYLIPYDTQRQGDTPKTATALRAEEFAEAVAALTPQRLFVILDCCHAAGVDAKNLGAYIPAALPIDLLLADNAAKDPASPGNGPKGLEQLAVGHGRAILSSSQGVERSYVRADRAMSIFTYHLIEALTGHAQPQGGATEVLVTDILSHVHRRVPDSARALGQDQHPDYKLTGNFPVALLLGGKGLGAGQPAPDPLTLTPPVGGAGGVSHRSVTTHGNITDSAIVTGDHNTIQQARGRNIAQAGPGGSATITDNSRRTAFDQRGQTVHGPQTNIDGGVTLSGGIFNTGIMTTGAAPSQAMVLADLRKLIAAVTQAGQQGILDTDTAIDAEGALRKAAAQVEKPDGPNRQTLLDHLTKARDAITAVAQNVTAVTGLVTAITSAIDLVRKWLP